MMKKTLLLLVLAMISVAPCWAANEASMTKGGPIAAKLSPSDKKDLERLEAYLNKLKSVSADFMQINENGEMRYGKIAIKRPGKMRVTYNPPSADLIVADGSFVHIWDAEMKQQSSVPVGSSIAEFILRDPIKLGGDVTVTRIARYPAKIELSLASTKDTGEGELTLIFEDSPLKLRQWRVVDPQGRTTGVNLENAREDIEMDSSLFHFVSPNFGKNGKDEPALPLKLNTGSKL